DDEDRGHGHGGEEWVSENKETGEDPDNAAQERPNPRDGAIDEDADQRQYPRDQPIKSQEGDDDEQRGAWCRDEHQAQNDARYPLQQKDPPDAGLLRLQRCGGHVLLPSCANPIHEGLVESRAPYLPPPPKKPSASRRICWRMNGSGSAPITMAFGWSHDVQQTTLALGVFRGHAVTPPL